MRVENVKKKRNAKMNYIYHRVPENMAGNILFPLNSMKETNKDIYDTAVKKYNGREKIMKRMIPGIDCLWNDCLHFSPVHPETVYSTLKSCGFSYNPEFKFFAIPETKFNENNTVVFFQDKKKPGNFEIFRNQIKFLSEIDLASLNSMPHETIDYYLNCFREKKHPLLFAGVPHVLYKGNIDITNLEIISWGK